MNTSLSGHDIERLVRARDWHIAGRLEQARPVYRQLLRKYPRDSDVQSLMAALLIDSGDHAGAIGLLERLAATRRNDADVFYNLGLARAESGDHEAAIHAYRRATRINPAHPMAWYNSGLSWRKLDRHDEAIKVLEQDFALAPRVDTARLLCRSHDQLGHHAECLYYARCCASLDGATPADLDQRIAVEARNLATSMYIDDAHAGELLAAAQHALDLQPDNAQSLLGLGLVQQQLGQHASALPLLERAMRLYPDLPGLRDAYSLNLLVLGRLEEGWRARTLPLRTGTANSEVALPRWSGSIRPGLKLLVKWEQGIGDQILYSRMLLDLADAGVAVTFVGEPRLVPLFSRSMPNVRSVARLSVEEQREHDAFVTLGELHIWLRPTLDTIPPARSWLTADPGITAAFRTAWQCRYPGQRIIGLSWHSEGTNHGASKSVPLETLAPILRTPECVFVNVQYGAGREAFLAQCARVGALGHIDEDCDALVDFDRSAAQIAALDELVTVSNTTAHLAGALGVPTHLLVSTRPLWHWFASGEESPWYPHVSIYRQDCRTSWDGPALRLASQLARRP
ncbi:MAG: tetratricopeptide repeat protein [Pseudomonadales bacterium]